MILNGAILRGLWRVEGEYSLPNHTRNWVYYKVFSAGKVFFSLWNAELFNENKLYQYCERSEIRAVLNKLQHKPWPLTISHGGYRKEVVSNI